MVDLAAGADVAAGAAAADGMPGLVDESSSDNDSTVGAALGAGRGAGRGARCCRLQRLQRVGVIFKQASLDASGSSGGCGVGGSIGPTGTLCIFKKTGLKGRPIADLGGGDGRVLMEASLWGASNGYALELAENKGNFAIYSAALCKMADDEYLRNCKTGFDLNGALRAGDIDEVAYVLSRSISLFAPDPSRCSRSWKVLIPPQLLSIPSGMASQTLLNARSSSSLRAAPRSTLWRSSNLRQAIFHKSKTVFTLAFLSPPPLSLAFPLFHSLCLLQFPHLYPMKPLCVCSIVCIE